MTTINFMMICRLCAAIFCLLLLTSSAAGSEKSIKIRITQKGTLSEEETLPLAPSSEQQLLEEQLMSFAQNAPDFQTFLKQARQNAAVPADPVEPCELERQIRQRLKEGDNPEELSFTLKSQLSHWFAKGYFVSMNRIVPADLFLRQFYDNFKMSGSGRKKTEVETLVPQTTGQASEAIVRVTAEGEGDSRQDALFAAIKEALSQVNAHWSMETERRTAENNSGLSSAFSEKTVVLYGGVMHRYNVTESQRTLDGKYKIVISAEIKKSSSAQGQTIKTADLLSDYIRNENREKAAVRTANLLLKPPASLFSVNCIPGSPDSNLIRIQGEISVNTAEYNRWTGEIAQLLSCAGVWESSCATLSTPVERFFTPEKLQDGVKTDSLYLCNLQKNSSGRSNDALTAFYRKYTLPERLVRQISGVFSISPEIVIELENALGQKLAHHKISFAELGIVFMPKGEAAVKTADFGFLNKYPVSQLIQPFFYDKNSEKRALKFSFEVELTLHPKLYARKPKVEVFALARPGEKPVVIPHDPKLATKEEGKAKYEEEEYEEAYSIFSELAQLGNTPDTEFIHYYLAKLAYEWQKNPDKAIKYLQNNNRPDAISFLGEIYEKAGRPAEALMCYRRLAQQGDVDGLERCGAALLKKGEFDEAVSFLEAAENKGSTGACYHLAEYYRNRKKNFKKAFPYYKKAADTKKDFEYYSHCLYYTARAYANGIAVAKNDETALFYLEKIIKRREKYSDAQYLAGIIKQKLPGKRHEAKEHFYNAARTGHIDGMFEYGCFLLTNDLEKAISYLKDAAEKKPEYYYYAGEKLYRCGEYDAAEKMLFSCIEKDSDQEIQGKAFWFLSILKEDKKDFAGANKFVKKAAACGNPDALCKLGQTALQKKDFKRSYSYLIKIRENPQALLLLRDLHAESASPYFSPKQALSLYNDSLNAAKKKAERSVESQAAGRIRRLQSKSVLLKN